MQKDIKSMDEPKIMIKSPAQPYPGICNLCTSKQHPTIDCPFSIILYHATNLDCLKSIVQNGFNIKKGRLGKALYCSDDPTMCVRFVLKNIKKFHDPVLIKIKAMVTNIKTVNQQQVKNITRKQIEEQGIDCIKCPYFRVNDKILYEFAIYETARQNSALYNSHACNKNFSIVSWSRIKLPQSLNRETSKTNLQNISNQSTIPNSLVAQICMIQKNVQQEKRKQEIGIKTQYSFIISDEKDQRKQSETLQNPIVHYSSNMDEQKQSGSLITKLQSVITQKVSQKKKKIQKQNKTERNRKTSKNNNISLIQA